MSANDPQREKKLKALAALRAWLNTHRALAWDSTENTAIQRVTPAVDVLQTALHAEK